MVVVVMGRRSRGGGGGEGRCCGSASEHTLWARLKNLRVLTYGEPLWPEDDYEDEFVDTPEGYVYNGMDKRKESKATG